MHLRIAGPERVPAPRIAELEWVVVVDRLIVADIKHCGLVTDLDDRPRMVPNK